MKSLFKSVLNSGKSVRHRELIDIFYNLSALLRVKVALPDALQECYHQTVNPALKEALGNVIQRVNSGANFSQSMSQETIFPHLATALVQTGEISGKLPSHLEQAAELLEHREEHRQTMAAALSYPMIILVITIFAASFLALFVAPQIADMYHRIDQPLPGFTRAVMWGGKIFIFVIPIISLAHLIQAKYRGSLSWSHQLIHLVNLLPIFRTIDTLQTTSLWAHSLGVLLSSKVQLTDALGMIARDMVDKSTADELFTVRRKIISGELPATAFQEMKNLPGTARLVLAAGDQSGQLAESCSRLHKSLDTLYRTKSRRLLSIVEPVAVIIAGFFVILVALAVMLPIAELGGIL